jgi:hypothetical protein
MEGGLYTEQASPGSLFTTSDTFNYKSSAGGTATQSINVIGAIGRGGITDIVIDDVGQGYSTQDMVVFVNSGTDGNHAEANIGVTDGQIELETSTIEGVHEFTGNGSKTVFSGRDNANLNMGFDPRKVQVFVAGSMIATLTSSVANSRMRIVGDAHSIDQHVEWLYAFDIHANAMFPTFLLLSVVQYVMLPLLLRPTYFAWLLANSLYAAGGLTYVYITHLGYRSMPFLRNSQLFLMPAGIVLLACALLTVFDLNVTRFTVWFVFE